MHWIFAQYFEASRKRERTGPHQVIKYIYWKLWQMLKKKKKWLWGRSEHKSPKMYSPKNKKKL